MAGHESSNARPSSDGERVLLTLRELRRAWLSGPLSCHPHDLSPWVVCAEADIEPELLVEHRWGWAMHFPGEVLLMESALGDDPWRLLSYEDWHFLVDVFDLQDGIAGPAADE